MASKGVGGVIRVSQEIAEGRALFPRAMMVSDSRHWTSFIAGLQSKSIPVIVGDEVARWFIETKMSLGDKFAGFKDDVFEFVPPYPRFVIDVSYEQKYAVTVSSEWIEDDQEHVSFLQLFAVVSSEDTSVNQKVATRSHWSAEVRSSKQGKVLSIKEACSGTDSELNIDIRNVYIAVAGVVISFLSTKTSESLIDCSKQFQNVARARSLSGKAREITYKLLKVVPVLKRYFGEASNADRLSVAEIVRAFHTVRRHIRRLPSGATTTVKAHTRGNPRKGITFKDYFPKTG